MFLNSRSQKHPDSVTLQKYQRVSNESFKHNSTHVSSLNLTPKHLLNLGFLCSSLTFTTLNANACSSWTPCYCIYCAAMLEIYQRKTEFFEFLGDSNWEKLKTRKNNVTLQWFYFSMASLCNDTTSLYSQYVTCYS